MPAGAQVLELGSGGDNPATAALVARYRHTGVDISGEQIARAHRAFPDATFVRADAILVSFDPSSFDAVVSLFMFGHIRRSEQGPLLERIADWLRPGGWFLATLGVEGSEDETDPDWLGTPMFFASFDERTNSRLLARARLEVVEARVLATEEPGHGPVRFLWVLAQKPFDSNELP